MPDALLATKVSLPILRRSFVPRAKVLRQLRAGIQDGHLLTLISAPAGYGKTTTIRMWVEEVGYPVAWVTLEKSDNDLRQFLTYMLAALQRVEDDLHKCIADPIPMQGKVKGHCQERQVGSQFMDLAPAASRIQIQPDGRRNALGDHQAAGDDGDEPNEHHNGQHIIKPGDVKKVLKKFGGGAQEPFPMK